MALHHIGIRKDQQLWDKKTQAKRPFRLWNPNLGEHLTHRNYATAAKAMIAALVEMRWTEVGHTLEVYDITTGALYGQYTRKVNSISFVGKGRP